MEFTSVCSFLKKRLITNSNGINSLSNSPFLILPFLSFRGVKVANQPSSDQVINLWDLGLGKNIR
jgi:hypothetical protein